MFTTPLLLLFLSHITHSYEEYPEGYYPFIKGGPEKIPPRVRKPPYTQTEAVCPGLLENTEAAGRSLNNLCGDLNSGLLPTNPLRQNVLGASYPFELIKNHTLELFSKTLPVLKEDKTLPKVAKFVSNNRRQGYNPGRRRVRSVYHDEVSSSEFLPFMEQQRSGRSFSHRGDDQQTPSMWEGVLKGIFNGLQLDHRTAEGMIHNLEEDHQRAAGRGASSFCRDNWGLFCLLYNSLLGREQQEEGRVEASERKGEAPSPLNTIDTQDQDGPVTPCPSQVQYVTPVFARNYQGVWRYVVQIPYEGYFTQTVETTTCLQDTCHYMRGACMASPRWVSMLVAEIFYPDAVFPNSPHKPVLTRGAIRPPVQEPFARRQGAIDPSGLVAPAPHYCDGVDQIGCFQVRLYYDWFLVPGSCKCWRRNVFTGQPQLRTQDGGNH